MAEDSPKRTLSGAHGPHREKFLGSADVSLPADREAELRAEQLHTYQNTVRQISGSVVVEPLKRSDPQEYGDDELYYGSVKVHLAPVPGSVIAYRHEDWQALADVECVALVLARAEKMGPRGDIIVPAIPALDFGLRKDAAKTTADSLSSWPQFLRTPLIKIGKNVPESMLQGLPGGPEKAFASGTRSCVLKLDGKWYRLKGSGNDDEGFIVKSELNAAGEFTRQIRGCAWLHTAVRENYMAAHLANSMHANGTLAANEAFGVYMYDAPNQPFGPDVSVPACIIERTHGDRRLGSHVLAGLELILPLLLDTSRLVGDELLSCFPPARKALPAGGDMVVSTAALMTDHMMALEFICAGMMEPGTHGLEFNVPRDKTSIANGLPYKSLPYRKLEQGVYPKQWMREGSKEMAPEWRPLWDKCVLDYNAALEKRPVEECLNHPLGYLFSRFGNDCGRIMRGMHDARVSWGTYQDEICVDDSQWHCNAHANNVVILAEGSSKDMLLGYLDLDMAFDDKTFVSVYGKGSPKGTVGSIADVHDALLKREHVNFVEVLAGADANNGVPMVARGEINSHPKCKELEVVKSILYDTLVLAYLNSYAGSDGDSFPAAAFDEECHPIARIVIKLAIMVMADFIA